MIFVDPVTAVVSGGGFERVIFDKIDATLAATWAARPAGIPLPQWLTVVARGRQNLADYANSTSVQMWSSDFLSYPSVSSYPWSSSVQAAGGSLTTVDGEENHPGIVSFNAVAAANSGYRIITNVSCVLLSGGESAQFIFKPITTGNTIARMGFQDAFALVSPTDGTWIHLDGTTLTGKTANNATESTTASSFTVTAGTWYRASVTLNAAGDSVEFSIVECSAPSVVVWNDTLTVNIPTASGRETGHMAVVYNTAGRTASLLQLD